MEAVTGEVVVVVGLPGLALVAEVIEKLVGMIDNETYSF